MLQVITHRAGILPQADGSATWACARYDLSDGQAWLLLDRARLTQARFTEETSSMDPAAKLSLRLKPRTRYCLYDVLADTVAARGTETALSDSKTGLEVR